jgi:hypothetical protein
MEKLSSVLTSLTAALPKNNRLKEQVVFWAYRQSVGEKTAKRLRPAYFDGSELVLECSDQRWMQFMDKDFEKDKVMAAINSAMKSNAVYRIRITPSR